MPSSNLNRHRRLKAPLKCCRQFFDSWSTIHDLEELQDATHDCLSPFIKLQAWGAVPLHNAIARAAVISSLPHLRLGWVVCVRARARVPVHKMASWKSTIEEHFIHLGVMPSARITDNLKHLRFSWNLNLRKKILPLTESWRTESDAVSGEHCL